MTTCTIKRYPLYCCCCFVRSRPRRLLRSMYVLVQQSSVLVNCRSVVTRHRHTAHVRALSRARYVYNQPRTGYRLVAPWHPPADSRSSSPSAANRQGRYTKGNFEKQHTLGVCARPRKRGGTCRTHRLQKNATYGYCSSGSDGPRPERGPTGSFSHNTLLQSLLYCVKRLSALFILFVVAKHVITDSCVCILSQKTINRQNAKVV